MGYTKQTMEHTANELFYFYYRETREEFDRVRKFDELVDSYLNQEFDSLVEIHTDVGIMFSPLFTKLSYTLHTSIIITCIILVEQEIKRFSEALKNELNLKLSIKDIKGSLLQCFRTYITKVADLNIELDEDIWKDINGAFQIRNCLIHYNGSLKNFFKVNVIKEFETKHGIPIIEEEEIVGKGDKLTIDGNISKKILDITLIFFETIYVYALERFPGQYTIDDIHDLKNIDFTSFV